MATVKAAAQAAAGFDAARSRAALTALLMFLTFTTGVMDAVSILALGRVFTALMTGNVVFIGLSLAGEPSFSAVRALWALLAFAAGAVAGGWLGRAQSAGPLRVWLLTAAALEAALLAGGAATAWVLAPSADQVHGLALYAIIALTAAAMGLRSATVVPIGDPDLKTTVLTLTITGLAADSPLARGRGERWQRRGLSIVMLGSGAWAGTLALHALGLAWTLVLMAALVMIATAVFAFHPSSAAPLVAKAR